MPQETKEPDIIRLKIPSDPKYVSTVRVMVEDLAKKNGFDKTKIDDLKLAINEALANVIEHAYSGLKNKVIFLYIIVHPNLLEIIIKDFGKKLDISMRVSDVMNTQQFKINTANTGYIQNFSNKRESRIAYLTLTYRFGNLMDNERKGRDRKRNNNNEDNGPDIEE